MHGNRAESKPQLVECVEWVGWGRVGPSGNELFTRALIEVRRTAKESRTYGPACILPLHARMFELSLSDHLRLTFGHIVYRQKAHARVAHGRIVAGRIVRGLEAGFTLGVVLTSLAAAYGRGPIYVIASAALGVLALITLLVHLTFDFDTSARAHASASARLWQIREQYRAVLSDLHDGAIDPAMARQRRDALTSTLRDFLEHAPSVASQPYQPDDPSVAVDEPALTDAQIDMFLPKSLQKSGRRVAT
jgi:hypothetical protein